MQAARQAVRRACKSSEELDGSGKLLGKLQAEHVNHLSSSTPGSYLASCKQSVYNGKAENGPALIGDILSHGLVAIQQSVKTVLT